MFIYSFVFNESYIRIITSKYTFIDTHTGCISRNNRYNEKKTNTTANNNSTTLGESTGEEQSPLTDQTGRKCVHNRCIAFILTYIYICILYVAYCSAQGASETLYIIRYLHTIVRLMCNRRG